MALGYGTDATADFATAVGRNAQATATSANAFGRDAIAAGTQATAIGDSYASGTDSFAAAIASNSSSYGAKAANAIAMGYRATASGNYAVAIGSQPTASASRAVSISEEGVASGAYSVCIGGYQPKDHGVQARFVIGSKNSNNNQFSIFQLGVDTTDATQTTLATNTSSASTSNQILLVDESVMSFTGTIAVREDGTDGDDYAAWEIKGAIMRGAGASTTTLGVGIVNSLYHTSGLANAAVALSADTTLGALKIQVTGIASTNLRWGRYCSNKRGCKRIMGKIEIDHTGSGGGITLSSDGTDLLLDGSAVGGGGGGATSVSGSGTGNIIGGTNAGADSQVLQHIIYFC